MENEQLTKFKNKSAVKILAAVFVTLIAVQRIYIWFSPTVEILLPAYGSFSVLVFRDTYVAGIDGTEDEVNGLNYESETSLGLYSYPNNTVKIRMTGVYKRRKVVATCISIEDIDNPSVIWVRAALELLPDRNYFYRRYIRLDDNFRVIEKYEKHYFFSNMKEADFYLVDRCDSIREWEKHYFFSNMKEADFYSVDRCDSSPGGFAID